MDNKELFYTQQRPHHVSLTHFFRRNWVHDARVVQAILSKCVVDAHLGALPPELRACVAKDMLADVTYKFRMGLLDFLTCNISDIRSGIDALHYDLPVIGDLFGLSCSVDFGAVNYAGMRECAGCFGIVGRMSFPEICAKYALKIFDVVDNYQEHGAMYEIPTAFAATVAEPRDNSRVYMALLVAVPYMLSRWEGDTADGVIRKNKNEIFTMSEHEAQPCNYRGGRRIDYGETYRTAYGTASYRVRKIYRKIINATTDNDLVTLREIAHNATVAEPVVAEEYRQAIDLVIRNADRNIYEILKKSKTY